MSGAKLSTLDDSASRDALTISRAARGRCELVGTIRKFVFSDDQTGAVILAVYCPKEGGEVRARGNVIQGCAQLNVGDDYKWYGKWTYHEKHGDQFLFTTYLAHFTPTKDSVIRYLQSHAPGVGIRRAFRLWDNFEADAITILKTQPQLVADAGIMSLDEATRVGRALAVASEHDDLRLALDLLLSGYGFPRKIVKACEEKYGPAAVNIIRADPFRLMVDQMPGAGFKRCDALYVALGLPLDAVTRQMWAAWHALKTSASGNTWCVAGVALKAVIDCVGKAKSQYEEAIGEAKQRKLIATRVDDAGREWLAEWVKATDERACARHVARLQSRPASLWPTQEELSEIAPAVSQHQLSEVEKIAESPFAILAGTPGTGKTFTAAAILRFVVQRIGAHSIRVAAPTGKAAVRITEAMRRNGVEIEATTIHSLLGVGEGGFKFCESEPLEASVVVVDECFPKGTLVDTPTGAKPIESLLPGDKIINASGEDTITATATKEVSYVCKITVGEKTLFASPNHPFFTARGVVHAIDLEPGDSVIQTSEVLRFLREENNPNMSRAGRKEVLQLRLCSELQHSSELGKTARSGSKKEKGRRTQQIPQIEPSGSHQASGKDSPVESNIQAGSEKEIINRDEGSRTFPIEKRRERSRNDGSGSETKNGPRRRVEAIYCSTWSLRGRVPNSLQIGSSEPRQDDSHRTGRILAQLLQSKSSGQTEGIETIFARVDRVEVLERKHPELDQFRNADGKLYFHDLRAARHPSFSVENLLVHNCSMLDTWLAASLFAALPTGTHVLLIGDPYQLAPVGHGAPLRDMIAAGVPCGLLTEIQRNAGRIVEACARIKDGKKFATSDKYEPEKGENLRWFEAGTPTEQVEILRSIMVAMKQFDPVWGCQVLVARNEVTPVSRVALNRLLQGMLNPAPATKDDDPPPEKMQHAYRLGDKIICLKNCWLNGFGVSLPSLDPTCVDSYVEIRDESGQIVKSYLANGEIGRVVAVAPQWVVMRFEEPARVVKMLMREMPGDDTAKDGSEGGKEDGDADGKKGGASDFALAYAITVHKAQGSEAPCVIVMVDDGAGWVASREFHYTAISRAKQLCIVIGRRSAFDRQARRVALSERKTFLAELLRGAGERNVQAVAEKPAAKLANEDIPL